ncbi:MAG: LAGLIDADG family homing endonuclease [Candidatus Binatia bacterium]
MADQHTTQTERLAWLAGIWDGEGHISIRRTVSKKSGKPQYSPRVGLTNSNMPIISRARQLLDSLDIEYSFREKGSGGPDGSLRKTGTIRIETLENASRLLTYLKPHLVGKRVQAEDLLELCHRRITAFSRKDPNSRRTYTQKDFELVISILEANRDIRGSAETVRQDAHRAWVIRQAAGELGRCDNCGTPFARRDPRGRFCSGKCRKTAWRKRRASIYPEAWRQLALPSAS